MTSPRPVKRYAASRCEVWSVSWIVNEKLKTMSRVRTLTQIKSRMLKEMKTPFILFFLLLANILVSAQQTNNLSKNADDDIYDVQDKVLIKTRDRASISATIVRKKGVTESLPAILFYTTYDQGSKDTVFGKKSAARGFVG